MPSRQGIALDGNKLQADKQLRLRGTLNEFINNRRVDAEYEFHQG